jgi:DNA-binding response OmpR family regulator
VNNQNAIHILVIDQLSEEVERLLLLLKDSDYKVSHTFNTKEALQMCLTNSPDLIILNIDEGGKENIAFFQKAKSHYATHSTPIIITTESTDHRKRIEYLEMGVDDLIVKPYYPEEIVARVGNVLQEYKSPIHLSKTIDRGFVGNLGEMDLIDLIQTMELGVKSGIIHLSRGDKEGKVFIRSGKIVDAVVPDYSSAKKAFLHMLTWIDGTFYVVFQDVPTGEPLTENNKILFEEATQIIKQWRAATTDLPSLHTQLVAVSDKASHAIGDQKMQMLESFKDSRTILQAIDRSGFEDIDGLTIIKALLEQGLLIESEVTINDDKSTVKMMSLPNSNGPRRFKNKYSHIFSIFQRKKGHENNPMQTQAVDVSSSIEKQQIIATREKINNRIRLTKAELLLIRQKLGS